MVKDSLLKANSVAVSNLQGLTEAVSIRKNFSQIKDIKSGLTNAVKNADFTDLKYWYATAVNCNAPLDKGFLNYINFMINLQQDIYLSDEKMNSKKLEQLSSMVSEGFKIKLSGYSNVLMLDYADCTLQIVQILQKKFQSSKQKVARMEKLINDCEKRACDHHLLPKLRMETIRVKMLEDTVQQLREATRLYIIEEMEDAMIDATKYGLTDIKEFDEAKKWYETEQKRLYELKTAALSQKQNFDVIIEEENQIKRIEYGKGFDNRKNFKSRFMEQFEQKEKENESEESDLEIMDIEVELARDQYKSNQQGNDELAVTEKDEQQEPQYCFKEEPFIPLWIDDLSKKQKEHQKGPPMSIYPYLRDWKNFRKMNVMQSKTEWLQYSKHKLPRTLSAITTERCGDKALSIQLKQLALTCFNENLRKVIGDSKLKKSETKTEYAIDYIISMSKHELLKDEAFLQLMKMTTNNETASCIAAWRMFYVLSMSFQPSGSLIPIVKTHVSKYCKTWGTCGFNTVEDIAALCWKYCDPDLRMKSRPVVPLNAKGKSADSNQTTKGLNRWFQPWHHSYSETLTYQSNNVVTEMRKLFSAPGLSKQLFAYSYDETEDGIPVSIPAMSDMNHIQVAAQICNIMGLLEPERYGLTIEIFNGDKDEQMHTLQIFAKQWILSMTPIRLIIDELEKISQSDEKYFNLRWRFIFIKWCYSPLDKNLDLESDIYVDFLYLQAFNQIMSGDVIRFSDEKIALLASLEMIKAQRGNVVGTSDLDPEQLEKLIPRYAASHKSSQEWMSLCVDSVKKLIKNGLEHFETSIHYERQYLKVAETSTKYGMSLFFVHVPIPARYDKYQYMLLGMNWHHIVLMTRDFQVVKQMSIRHLKSIKQDKSNPYCKVILLHKESKTSDAETSYEIQSLSYQASTIVQQLFQLRKFKSNSPAKRHATEKAPNNQNQTAKTE